MDQPAGPDRASQLFVVLGIVALVVVGASVWALLAGVRSPVASDEAADTSGHEHHASDGEDESGDTPVDEHAGHAVPPTPTTPWTPSDFEAPYEGPIDAAGVQAACAGSEKFACITDELKALLTARGSVAAFAVLADIAESDADVDRDSHAVAHALGAHALDVHGTIQDALSNCSYEVFQGCFHGALQAHFMRNPDFTATDLRTICPEGTAFEEYVCLHGLGHGLMLATQYDLFASLTWCNAIHGEFGESSCYGGAYMENVVAYMDAAQGKHVHMEGVEYVVRTDDPLYPCNAVDVTYRESCWLMQTSLILFLNGGDFSAVALVCAGLEPGIDNVCFVSMGRDASAYSARDPVEVSGRCAFASGTHREYCIRGFSAEVVLNYADPVVAIPYCAGLLDIDKKPCYFELGVQGSNMLGEGMAEVCAQVEADHVNDCRAGAWLPAT